MHIQSRTHSHHIYQLQARLIPSPDGKEMAHARTLILDWLGDRIGRRPSQAAYNGEGFFFEQDGGYSRPVEAVANGNIWALRFEHPDEGGRIWRTEAALGKTDTHTLFGTRLVCLCHPTADRPSYSKPKFVYEIGKRIGLNDSGYRIQPVSTIVTDAQEALQFSNFLTNPYRTLPVVVISEKPQASHPYVMSPDAAARKLCGLAHVFALTSSASWILSGMLSKEWSVFNGAVRYYRPRLDTEADELFRHPIAMPETIRHWTYGSHSGAETFLRHLVVQSYTDCSGQTDNEKSIPPFPVIKSALLKKKAEKQATLETPASCEQEASILKERISALEMELSDTFELADEQSKIADKLSNDLERTTQDRNALLSLTSNLRAENERLRKQLERAGKSLTSRVSIPDSLEEIGPWASMNYPDKLLLLRRAVTSAKKADFHDPSLVFKSLNLLANEYYDMIFNNTSGARSKFNEAAKALGVEVSKTYTGDKPIKHQETYSVQWGRERQYFDKHLAFGNSRDPRYCMRIYFFHDDASRRLVIGHLPDHLPNTLS